MKVYHVYEVFYGEPWYPEECSARIYKNYADAKKYFDHLVNQGVKDEQSLDYLEERYAQFNTDDCDEFKVFIDEYELM